VSTGVHEQAGRPVAHVVQPHRRQASPSQKRLEVLREPGAVDSQPALGDEDQRVAERHQGTLDVLSFEVSPQAVNGERRERDGSR
jgi:hypothetical protein